MELSQLFEVGGGRQMRSGRAEAWAGWLSYLRISSTDVENCGVICSANNSSHLNVPCRELLGIRDICLLQNGQLSIVNLSVSNEPEHHGQPKTTVEMDDVRSAGCATGSRRNIIEEGGKGSNL